MKIIIFCGGLGTRLREETEYKPKPLVDIGGKPILWHIMKIFSSYGIKEFILCLGYKGHLIKEYFINYEAMNNDFTVCLGSSSSITYHNLHDEQNFVMTLADTGLHSMTGGRLKRVEEYLDDEPFIVTYGDGLADINVQELIEFHKSHRKLATVTTVKPTSRFGLLDIDEDGSVNNFCEKPQIEGWASAGFFVFDKRIFNYLSDDSCVLEQEPLIKLTQDQQLMAYQHHGCFYTMDTYREYKQLNEIWDAGNAPWKVWK